MGLTKPTGVLRDTQGNVYIGGNGYTLRMFSTVTGVMTQLAGVSGNANYADGTGTQALFGSMGGMTFDAFGNILVADVGSQRIRMVTTSGVVTTLIYSPDVKYSAVAYSPDWSLLYATELGHIISVITTSAPATRVVLTGTGSAGYADGLGTNARFNRPVNIVMSTAGNMYVADQNNFVIRKINADGESIILSFTSFDCSLRSIMTWS
jgi:hypothetical protein